MNQPLTQTAAAQLKRIAKLRPTLALVLGSGFQHVLTAMRVDRKIPYAKIPGYPVTGVRGHAGEVIFGWIDQVPVLVLSGRAHFYEGYSMEQLTFPIRTLAALGVRNLLLTNAAGGINKKFRPGDFMVLTDHINLMGVNPLRGERMSGLSGFVDMTRVYDSKLSALLFRAGKSANLRLRRGVYLAVSGPSYETPAEIRAFARLGADAVGMSTVPEAMGARQYGLNVAAVSCITNVAAGLGPGRLSHSEVLKTAEQVKVLAVELLKNFVRFYGETDKL
jgi:purine-nucleoside phosphorylase